MRLPPRCNLCPNEAVVGSDPLLCPYCSYALRDKERCRTLLVGYFLLDLKARGHPNPEAAAALLEERLKEKENKIGKAT